MEFNIIFLCLAGMLAAFVDSIAGGGGLISLPAYLLAGVPPHFALGTNKFSSTAGSFFSTLGYARSSKINFRLLKFAVPATILGAILGVYTVLRLPQDLLYPFVSGLILVVGVYTVMKKDLGAVNGFTTITNRKILFGTLVGFVFGFYDGFFGPGTGSFLIFIFIRFFKYDFIHASGNSKLINFTSNITSLVMFALNGKINYAIGIPVALFMIIGSNIGTRLAIRNGAKFIRPIFVTMSLAVFVKLIYQMMT